MKHLCNCGWTIHSPRPISLRCRNCGCLVDCSGGGRVAVSGTPDIKTKPIPNWVYAITRLRKDSDRGVGDTVQRLSAWLGGELFKAFAKKIGIPCGCAERQAKWNSEYPYETM